MEVAVGQRQGAQVSLLVADDRTLRELNRRFRGLDEITDVLSFSTVYAGHWEGDSDAPDGSYLRPGDADVFDLPLPPGELPPLGDVALSYPQAERQAAERRHSPRREVAHLIIHGLLHLAGHDHEEPEERALMEARERAGMEAVSRLGAGCL